MNSSRHLPASTAQLLRDARPGELAKPCKLGKWAMREANGGAQKPLYIEATLEQGGLVDRALGRAG